MFANHWTHIQLLLSKFAFFAYLLSVWCLTCQWCASGVPVLCQSCAAIGARAQSCQSVSQTSAHLSIACIICIILCTDMFYKSVHPFIAGESKSQIKSEWVRLRNDSLSRAASQALHSIKACRLGTNCCRFDSWGHLSVDLIWMWTDIGLTSGPPNALVVAFCSAGALQCINWWVGAGMGFGIALAANKEITGCAVWHAIHAIHANHGIDAIHAIHAHSDHRRHHSSPPSLSHELLFRWSSPPIKWCGRLWIRVSRVSLRHSNHRPLSARRPIKPSALTERFQSLIDSNRSNRLNWSITRRYASHR